MPSIIQEQFQPQGDSFTTWESTMHASQRSRPEVVALHSTGLAVQDAGVRAGTP